jgi:hypothetical protein
VLDALGFIGLYDPVNLALRSPKNESVFSKGLYLAAKALCFGPKVDYRKTYLLLQ